MTAILSAINPTVGSGIGFVMPALFVPDDKSVTIEKGKR